MFFLWSSHMWRYIKKTNNIDTAIAFQQSDSPTKILKQNSGYFPEHFYGYIKQCISKSMFPPDLN